MPSSKPSSLDLSTRLAAPSREPRRHPCPSNFHLPRLLPPQTDVTIKHESRRYFEQSSVEGGHCQRRQWKDSRLGRRHSIGARHLRQRALLGAPLHSQTRRRAPSRRCRKARFARSSATGMKHPPQSSHSHWPKRMRTCKSTPSEGFLPNATGKAMPYCTRRCSSLQRKAVINRYPRPFSGRPPIVCKSRELKKHRASTGGVQGRLRMLADIQGAGGKNCTRGFHHGPLRWQKSPPDGTAALWHLSRLVRLETGSQCKRVPQ